MDLRAPAVAGMFYPGETQALRATVQQLLDGVDVPAGQRATWPKAVIVPHAGFRYSGSTAAQAYARLAPGRGTIRKVLLLGPVHRVPVRGLALPGSTRFATPLGEIPVDEGLVQAAARLPQVVVSPAAHAMEHALEVQLPFLQQVLGEFTLLPLAVGSVTGAQVAEVLQALWGGPETVIVISSDLSHFHPYEQAQAIDRATVQHVLRCEPGLDPRQACGAIPVNGMLLAARSRGLAPQLLHLCNSGDTAGDRQRVVGYASFAFEPAAVQPVEAVGAAGAGRTDGAADLPDDAGPILLDCARSAIAAALGLPARPQQAAPWLDAPGASFVTLTRDGALRGCIGSLEPRRALGEDVRANAVAAALHDSRFPPLAREDYAGIRVEVSVLSRPQPFAARNEDEAVQQLRPGVDGVVLRMGGRRATFLPQVWEQLPAPRTFLAHLRRKAGLPPGFWAPGLQLERYTVRKWKE